MEFAQLVDIEADPAAPPRGLQSGSIVAATGGREPLPAPRATGGRPPPPTFAEVMQAYLRNDPQPPRKRPEKAAATSPPPEAGARRLLADLAHPESSEEEAQPSPVEKKEGRSSLAALARPGQETSHREGRAAALEDPYDDEEIGEIAALLFDDAPDTDWHTYGFQNYQPVD